MMVARANNDGDEKLIFPLKCVSEFSHVLKSYRLRVFSGKETKSIVGPRPVSWRGNVET